MGTELTGRRRRRAGRIAIGTICILVVTALVVVSQKPSLAAHGADFLRGVIGDKAVASLETALFQFEDAIQRLEYSLGLVTPTVPWSGPIGTQVAIVPTPTRTFQQTLVPTPPSARPLPPVTPTPSMWQPAPLEPMGTLAGEGIWSPYIQDASGRTVGFRTYLQPDKTRPILVDVVAFDLRHTRLHFVLGTVEPYSPNAPKRSGLIPASDRVPGVLLAMFNGGFKAIHGHFGAMADGITALPPKPGLGTLAIYSDGTVRMGAWGTESIPTTDMVAFRQNGPLMVDQGVINPQVNSFSPADWGYTIKSVTPTLRSGVGLSADGSTLYFACGPFITVETLARAMQTAGAVEAMQLDINWYWVLFVAVRTKGESLTVEALDPKNMNDDLNRYLWAYTRDYFYVTGSR
ncbi:MAG: phosphodiester glycosidase family protein [Anaerolineales bacterium]|jgi:hypothetical protein